MNHLPLRAAAGSHRRPVEVRLRHTRARNLRRVLEGDEHPGQVRRHGRAGYHLTGWYDDLTHETITNFVNMRKLSRSEHARRWQKLLIGPWGHGVRSDRSTATMDFGAQMATDLRQLHLHWYDYHLKGEQNGLDKEAPIRIFVMGAERVARRAGMAAHPRAFDAPITCTAAATRTREWATAC